MAASVLSFPQNSFGAKKPSHRVLKTPNQNTIVTKPAEVKVSRPRIVIKPVLSMSELVELVTVAKKAADAVASKKFPETHPDCSRCLEALEKLKKCSIKSLLELSSNTKLMNCIEKLSWHPKSKIRSEAADILLTCKRLRYKSGGVVQQQKVDEVKPLSKPKASDVVVEEGITNNAAPTPRSNSRQRILDALSKVALEVVDESAKAAAVSGDIKQIASSIENLIHQKLCAGSDCKIKAQCRSILFNLTDANNPDLRRRVLLGEIKPEKLFEMNTEEMASDKRKQENEEIRKKREFQKEEEKKPEATTSMFRCGKCGQRKCTYYQLQTRSADEPMTNYVTCVVCENHWKC